jgi:hypothetical protein
MADGDMIDQIVRRGTVQTTDGTDTVLLSIPIPVGAEGVVAIRAWAHGTRINTSSQAFIEELLALGYVDGGNFSFANFVSLGSVDVSTSGYATQMDQSGNNLRLLVTGAASNTVRWHGRVNIEITAQALSLGG